MSQLFEISEWFFLFYFVSLNLSYLLLNLVSIVNVSRYMKEKTLMEIPGVGNEILPPVSIIVPAYQEGQTIVRAVKALMQQDYPNFEIIIVNDGSTDDTLGMAKDFFKMEIFPEASRIRLKTKEIKAVYRSTTHNNLRLVDKENGGKGDSVNAGVNVARYPLVCVVDADSILQTNSLKRVVQPFIFDNRTVASGGTVRIANGSDVRDGYLINPKLPNRILPLIQVIEYLRAFLFGRLGWSPMNALLLISGAFGVFHKETLVSVGGFRSDTLGEDMELTIRMHRLLRKRKKDYRITFVPDPVCWTYAPETITGLAHQRIRWQRGLCESLFMNISLLFNPKAGTVGLLAFPFMLLFEWAGPLVELFGFAIIVLGFALGYIEPSIFILLLGVAILFGMLLSVAALFLEESSFHIYQKPKELFKLIFVAIIENLGYRQLNTIFRLIGFTGWLFGTKQKWVR